MGGTASKFKKYLQNGDEFAAMQIYQNSPELRKNLNPNSGYGENHNHNTALHYAAKHGMKHLLRTFLNDLGGDPNKRNGSNETVLHCACQLNQSKSFSAQERRAACVQIILHWKGPDLADGSKEKVDLSALDKDGNTALHCASAVGLKRCVELLLAYGSPIFNENHEKMTPCDLAMKGSYHDIAQLLESRMVFTEPSDSINEDDINKEHEIYSGLRSQDLQEAKDQLLVDTSDMLKIPLFTAEALLRKNEWSRELLLEKWMRDPIECCRDAGVKAPSSLQGSMSSDVSPDLANGNASENEEIMCEICYLSVAVWDQLLQMSCKHTFCKFCWEIYLTNKIQDGDAHHILCPAYQCHILVPVELIEKYVKPEIAKRYLQFDIKAFVESNKSIKWCPMAGCGRAVRLPEAEQKNENSRLPVTSHAVDCGNAHFFCWECLGEAHAPCACSQWQEWQQKIAEVKPEELKASCSGSEEAANCLWLISNAKPCPNCKSPIQKNEGCNHMKCSKCKYEFCWVCQESWKQHSSATGGFFRCNRFESVQKVDEKHVSLYNEAKERNDQMQEISRFLHFYMRYKNHENSQKLEEPLLNSVHQKMKLLASSLGLEEDNSTKFIEQGIRELLKARRVLCGSYVFGYYLKDDGHNKTIFEFMQNELEEVTEKLSEMIARPYLKTPKAVIIQTTALTRRKRHEFIRAVAQGLIPPETPPTERKAKKRRYLDIDISHPSAWLRDCPRTEFDSDEEDLGHSTTTDNEPHVCTIECARFNCDADYNVQIFIALEMSRMQIFQDSVKHVQQQTSEQHDDDNNQVDESTSVADDQLKLAIELSLQEQAKSTSSHQKSSADLTVDYFLKSLANHKLDFRNLDVGCLGSDVWGKRDQNCLFKPCNSNEDGRFRISEIHDRGFGFDVLECTEDYAEHSLKRSRSTGDLYARRINPARIRWEPRYHLDSDHSSQHDEKPEDVSAKILSKPSTARNNKLLLMHQQLPFPEDEYYQGQSSEIDDTTTTSESINVDIEVSNIMESAPDSRKTTIDEEEGEDEESQLYVNVINKNKTDDISRSQITSAVKAKLICSETVSSNHLSRVAVTKRIGLISNGSNNNNNNDSHANNHVKARLSDLNCQAMKSKDAANGKNLRIKICHDSQTKKSLETDSSVEYESETGIPKSPTLYISGVSISRTPEPKSPATISIVHGRQSRSSSLSVPAPLNTCSLNASSTSLIEVTSGKFPSTSSSPVKTKEESKSKSANEPEREREMFCFPKSSTDGALSSVLHVHKSNLSSDDFHEALFLLENNKEPKRARKKSKKRDASDSQTAKSEIQEEVSSAL